MPRTSDKSDALHVKVQHVIKVQGHYAPTRGGRGARRNRSVTQFDGITKAMMSIAAKRIEMITFFEDPLPDARRTEAMLANAWRAAEVECGVDGERTTQRSHGSRIWQWVLKECDHLYSLGCNRHHCFRDPIKLRYASIPARTSKSPPPRWGIVTLHLIMRW